MKSLYGDQWEKRGPLLLAVLSVFFILATVIYFGIGIHRLRQMPSHHVSETTAPVRRVGLADQSLFGSYDHVPKPQLAQIGLTVVGLVADPVDSQSRSAIAVLRNSAGESKPYHFGNSLPGGYTITEITPRRVMMQNANGLVYYLELSRPHLADMK